MAPAPVRSTYAHKRTRAPARNIPSSPQQAVDQLEEDITRSEMSRRMLKRSRRSHESVTKVLSIAGVQERLSKRLKPSPRIQPESLDPNVMTVTGPGLVQFDINDASQFQTPHPSILTEQFKLNSSVGCPIPPEQFSPLPVAHRILSRRNSRNLKENSRRSRSRGLASPFNSRPGSVTSSPKKMDKSKRRPLGTKSRTLSDNKNRSTQKRKPSVSVANSTANSPRPAKKILHNRRPSVPTPPSHMLQQIAQHDWFIPPQTLSRELSDISHFSDSPSQQIHRHSPFLGGFAQAYSTPLRKHVKQNDAYTPQSGYVTPETTDYHMANHLADTNYDVIMNDSTQASSRHRRRITAPSGSGPCSIISPDSCLLRSHSASEYSAPAYVPGPSVFNDTNLNHALAFPHLSLSMDEDQGGADDSIFPSTTRLGLTEYIVPVLSTSPGPDSGSHVRSSREFGYSNFPSFPPSPTSLIDPSLNAHPPWAQSNADEMAGSDPVLATPPMSQKLMSLVPPSMSPVSEKLKEMFSELDIDGARIPTHDSGICLSDDTSHTHRSLDSPVEIEPRKPLNNNNKDKCNGKRNRAGTIRASDLMQTDIEADVGNRSIAPPGGNGSGITRRTRSGTVMGPSYAPSRTRSGTIIGPPRPAPASKAKAAPRNQRHAIRPVEDLDLGVQAILNSEDESEDELLLKAHWHDDDWVAVPAPVPVRAQGKGKMRMWNTDDESQDGDDELLLVAGKEATVSDVHL